MHKSAQLIATALLFFFNLSPFGAENSFKSITIQNGSSNSSHGDQSNEIDRKLILQKCTTESFVFQNIIFKKNCVFPFTYEGKIHHTCSYHGNFLGRIKRKAWCSFNLSVTTNLTKETEKESVNWYYCSSNCITEPIRRCNNVTYPTYEEMNGCCSKKTPCDLGEGYCHNNDHCKGGLICGQENCNKFTFPSGTFGYPKNCCELGKNDGYKNQLIGLSILFIFLLTVMGFSFIARNRKKLKKKKKIDITSPLMSNQLNPSRDLKSQVSTISMNLKREIPVSSFEVIGYLGSGQFGKVQKGKIKEKYSTDAVSIVAIKSVHTIYSEENIDDFLKEIKIMGYLDHHLNLVNMIGSCTRDYLKTCQMFLLLEYCTYGDIKVFLLENKVNILHGGQSDNVNIRSLVLWAYDVAKGMQYLEENHIMHGDLAARNILLDEAPSDIGHSVAKIADFGLAKNFYDKKEYKKESRLLIPWKWMALEYLTYDILTLKSDVWSFGIVLWEIFSFGKVPYGQHGYDEVLEKLESGYRLPCPIEIENVWSNTPKKLYEELSKICLAEDPSDRPTFFEISTIIGMEMTQDELIEYDENTKAYHSDHVVDYLSLNKNK